jgi:DNA adenine methylase
LLHPPFIDRTGAGGRLANILRRGGPLGMSAREWGPLRSAGPGSKVSPFLKWAGGKRQLLPALTPYIWSSLRQGKYFEPFLGGGAVFFSVQPRYAILSDLNEPLIRTYRVVKDRCEELLAELEALPKETNKIEYARKRNDLNRLLVSSQNLTRPMELKLAALLIWINHQCFNGLFRVNRTGEFNVPFGRYRNPRIYSESGIRSASRVLRRARAVLLCSDFEKVLEAAETGDVVYLDPPYVPLTNTSNFTSYTKGRFGPRDQIRLASVVHRLARRGVHVVLSNSSTESARSLYADMRQVSVSAARAINCVGSKRGKVEELVVLSEGIATT